MFLKCDVKTATDVVEEFLKLRSMKYEKLEFHTGFGLRKVEYRLKKGKITIIIYLDGVEIKLPKGLNELRKILEVYTAKESEIIKNKNKRDVHDLKLEYRIYEAKIRLALRGIAIRTAILLATVMLIPISERTLPLLLVLTLTIFLLPEREKYFDLAEPSEWSIPLLLPYYVKKMWSLSKSTSGSVK